VLRVKRFWTAISHANVCARVCVCVCQAAGGRVRTFHKVRTDIHAGLLSRATRSNPLPWRLLLGLLLRYIQMYVWASINVCVACQAVADRFLHMHTYICVCVCVCVWSGCGPMHAGLLSARWLFLLVRRHLQITLLPDNSLWLHDKGLILRYIQMQVRASVNVRCVSSGCGPLSSYANVYVRVCVCVWQAAAGRYVS
jgi:hypothetical protein